MISLQLPEDLECRLENYAVNHNNSKSFFMEEALRMYLDDMEDAEEALERLSDPKAEYVDTRQMLDSLDDI